MDERAPIIIDSRDIVIVSGVSWKTGWLEGGSGDRTKLPLSVNGLAGQILRATRGREGLFDERQFVYR